MSAGTRVAVEVGGRRLSLSNLDKPLYPDGFTKAQVIEYVTHIAPVLLPHLADRPLTFKRYPEGAAGPFFYEKNAPRHRPEWVRTEQLPSPGSTKGRETIGYAIVEELATLVWAANLATLELHVPQWRVRDHAPADPDLLVLDLDPGPPAGIVECCEVACLLRTVLERDGYDAVVKTSGSKGLQLYARALPGEPTSDYAHRLAQQLEAAHPELILSRMTRSLRAGKVLVDWSQNSPAKTTVAVYSLRARERPTVSTPVTWQEVEACRTADDLTFCAPDVLERVARHGDLFAPLLATP